MQTRDQNKYAATAFALTEMRAFGIDYARQMIANAKALGAALMAEGLTVHAAERGYTMTHQIFLDATAIDGRARRVEQLCRNANLLFQASHMCGDAARGERTGLRLSVQELTRLGMREAEMRCIAGFVRRAVLDGEPPAGIASEVAELASQFSTPQYTFTSLS